MPHSGTAQLSSLTFPVLNLEPHEMPPPRTLKALCCGHSLPTQLRLWNLAEVMNLDRSRHHTLVDGGILARKKQQLKAACIISLVPPVSSPMAACKCSPPASPVAVASSPAPERWSSRLEDRRRTSLGPFQALPCEVIQIILAFVPGECRGCRVRW